MTETWEAWISALGDRQRPLRILVCGRMRDQHWDMGRRVLGDHMLHIIREGGQEGWVCGRPLRTGPGDTLWVPAGVEQTLRKRADARWLGKDNLRFTLEGAKPPPIPTITRAGTAGEHLSRLRGEWLTRQPGREGRLRALCVILFSELWRSTSQRSLGLDEAAQARLITLVDRDIAARPSPAVMARELGLSANWFSRLFRRTFGCAPRTWLMRHRIERATERLESARSIGEVASEFGYPDLFLFSRQFRQVMGACPRRWLAEHHPGTIRDRPVKKAGPIP